jgi:hypothetical protein
MTQRKTNTSVIPTLPHITGRDRILLQLLDDHSVLTTDQVHRLLFLALRTCQIRLSELRAIGLVERFRFARASGTLPWHWTLGLAGHRLQAAVHHRTEPTARSYEQALARLAVNPHLNHRIAVNEFFVRLATYARHTSGVRLERWWSEQRATEEFQTVRPDGHGIWTVGDRTVGAFLECDQRTESPARLIGKLRSYKRLAATNGPRYPVLLWLSSPERELHLHDTLRAEAPSVPVATATHDADPAGPVWLPGDGEQRVPLTELDSFHGRATAANPNFRDGQLHLDDGDLDYSWARA